MFSKNEWLLRRLCCCFVRSMNDKVKKVMQNNEKSRDKHLHALGGVHGVDGHGGGGDADVGVREDTPDPNPNPNCDINLEKTKSDTSNKLQETGSDKTNRAHSIDMWSNKKSQNENNSPRKNDDKIESEKDEPHSQSQFSAIEKQLADVIQSENE